jgi:hypothetical protein
MRRWQNVGRVDRLVRVGIGVVLLAVGLFSGIVIADAVVLVGAVLVLTGLFGYCPFYAVLGIRTAPPPSRSRRAA